MSASRICLLAATALGGVLTPTASCWAQAYGAAGIVEHNDLRWFEPVELDIDGQMPRRDAGYFASMDKLYWATINPKVEIGHEGLTVDSERIYRAPSNPLALLALQQVEALDFIDNLQENLEYSGIQFVIANTKGTDSLSDDVTMTFNTAPFATVAQLETAISDFNNLQANIDANLQVRVGGEPTPYQVRNGIRDALPDAGFAWGERYAFGYSDGERGWMVEILDGPESTAGGTWGAGEAGPYTSQSGTDVYGPDPYFLSDLQDDNGDGIGDGDGELGAVDLFALGFGSVAVNFNLPTPDFLDGYRDYFDNSAGVGTTTGPIMYVGNYGTVESDLSVVDIGNNPGATRVEIDDAIIAIQDYDDEASDPPTVDPNETALDSLLAIMLNEVNSAGTIIGGLDEEDQVTLGIFFGNALNSIAALQAAQNVLAAANAGMVPPNQLDGQIAAVNNALVAFNAALAGIVLEVEDGAGGNNQNVNVNEQVRQPDDLDGNGQAGVFRVLADIDGDGVIEPGEIIGIINNFGDLHTFNVFFDQVTVRNRTEIDGVELMRMHELSTRHKMQQGRWDDLRLTYGVRFLSVRDEFYFRGLGSILGRTTVETDLQNQIVGPQVGLKWTRRDGPWNFVLEGRGMMGYNIVDADQYGIFGEEAIPGALNRSAVARTTTSVDGDRFDEFSPVAELRAQLQYRIAESISLQAGYTAKYVGNIHRGSTATAWNAPDFGIYDRKGDLFTNGLTFGVELRH
ncbi:hypothetical protein Pla108_36010 [Botrimarina colliarenosi]|uniref:EF-hand domain-containing protein n=1 Tax=Botrimarina colliarenosi TaxID=2528001 RepID=A0A5C6A4A0_9BACT|nr:BBP7 family outer membrane beta-barrel protein [Botrimarina colliarenosi]TWT94752.1 hypothetical protein Pla108_36010 [Botrimarina colliarenosi]